jgi:hypothetical protein
MRVPLAIHDYSPGGLEAAREFVKRTRAELRELRWVRLWKDRFQIVDVNKDCFEIRGLGYVDADIVPLLQMINTAYNPETLAAPTEAEYKEYDTGRRYPWAHDRVL